MQQPNRPAHVVQALATQSLGFGQRIDEPRLTVLALHPQIIGRPGRLAMLEEFLRWVLDQGDVRVARCAEIAAGVA